MQYCTSSAFGFESSRDPRVIYVKERIIETPTVYVLFLLAIEENSTWPGEKRGEGCGGGVRNVAWVTGRRCTREQSALPQSWGSDRAAFPAPVSIERKRTFAVRALGQWCARKRRVRIPPFSLPRIKEKFLAGFLIQNASRSNRRERDDDFKSGITFGRVKENFKNF